MTRGDALLHECFRDFRNQLQPRKPRVDVAGTLVEFPDQCSDFVAGQVKQAVKPCTS